jgi:hypothetical protein
VIEIIRKVGLVLCQQLITIPAVQSFAAAFCVFIVLCGNYYFRPCMQCGLTVDSPLGAEHRAPRVDRQVLGVRRL